MGHEIPGPNEIYIYINDSSRESNRAAWRDDTREIKHECFLLFLRSARASSSSIPIQPVQSELPRFWTKTDTRLLKTALTINNRIITPFSPSFSNLIKMEEEEEEKISAMEEQKRKKEEREKKTVPTNWMPLGKSTIPDNNPITHRMEAERIQERGRRRKTGGRKAGQRGKRNLTDQDIDHSAPFGSKSRDRSPDSGKISRRDSCLFEETHFSRGGRLAIGSRLASPNTA